MTILFVALYFLCLIATAILAGILQGMVMVKPTNKMHKGYEWVADDINWNDIKWWKQLVRQFDLGVRGHVWFSRYHLISGLVIVGSMIIGHWLIENAALTPQYLVTICLMAVLANDLFEYGYSYARFKTLINPHPEHFTIGDLVVKIPWYGWHKVKYEHEYSGHIDGEYGWHLKQILPFHVSSWKMHAVRFAIIFTLGGMI